MTDEYKINKLTDFQFNFFPENYGTQTQFFAKVHSQSLAKLGLNHFNSASSHSWIPLTCVTTARWIDSFRSQSFECDREVLSKFS